MNTLNFALRYPFFSFFIFVCCLLGICLILEEIQGIVAAWRKQRGE